MNDSCRPQGTCLMIPHAPVPKNQDVEKGQHQRYRDAARLIAAVAVSATLMGMARSRRLP